MIRFAEGIIRNAATPKIAIVFIRSSADVEDQTRTIAKTDTHDTATSSTPTRGRPAMNLFTRDAFAQAALFVALRLALAHQIAGLP